MKYKLLLICLLTLTTLISAPQTKASPETAVSPVDINVLKQPAYDFFNLLAKQGNFPVWRTYAGGSNRYHDWNPNTFMKSSKIFFVTTPWGVEVRAKTVDPPALLENYRPRLDGYDMDGNIPMWDREYEPRYAIWRTYDCLDLNTMLKNPGFEGFWLALLYKYGVIDKEGHVLKGRNELEAIGLDPDTGRSIGSYHAVDLSITPEQALANITIMQDETTDVPDSLLSATSFSTTISPEEAEDGVIEKALITPPYSLIEQILEYAWGIIIGGVLLLALLMVTLSRVPVLV